METSFSWPRALECGLVGGTITTFGLLAHASADVFYGNVAPSRG